MNPSLKDLINLYNTKFKPAYADLVGYIGDKPVNILVELENALSHVFVSIDASISKEIKEDNIKKAYNHLIRATLDCYKLLWIRLDEDIEKIFKSKVSRLALTVSEEEFLHLRGQFKSKAIEARKRELKEIGKNPLQSIYDYQKVAAIGMKIINSVDDNKKITIKAFQLKSKWWEILLSFLIGAVSSLFADMILSKLLH